MRVFIVRAVYAPDRQTRIGGLAAGLGGSKEKAARVSGLRLGLGKETARRQTASDDRKASVCRNLSCLISREKFSRRSQFTNVCACPSASL